MPSKESVRWKEFSKLGDSESFILWLRDLFRKGAVEDSLEEITSYFDSLDPSGKEKVIEFCWARVFEEEETFIDLPWPPTGMNETMERGERYYTELNLPIPEDFLEVDRRGMEELLKDSIRNAELKGGPDKDLPFLDYDLLLEGFEGLSGGEFQEPCPPLESFIENDKVVWFNFGTRNWHSLDPTWHGINGLRSGRFLGVTYSGSNSRNKGVEILPYLESPEFVFWENEVELCGICHPEYGDYYQGGLCSDGEMLWSQGLPHLIREHNVPLSGQYFSYFLKKLKEKS